MNVSKIWRHATISPCNEKKREFFFLIFRNCPKKGAKGDAVYIVNAPLKCFEKDEAEEATKKIKLKKKKINKFFF